MEYSDVGNLRFLIGRLLDFISSRITNAHGATPDLDAEALYLEALASYITEQDTKFQKEWATINKQRIDEGWRPDVDESEDLKFRILEIRCIVRSLAREGILTRLEAPTVKWKPEVKVA